MKPLTREELMDEFNEAEQARLDRLDRAAEGIRHELEELEPPADEEQEAA